jgi:hypothetical protein
VSGKKKIGIFMKPPGQVIDLLHPVRVCTPMAGDTKGRPNSERVLTKKVG